MTTDRKKVVSVKNASKKFKVDGKELTALNNVSFDIFDGEILSILGPNGAGKTTLINMMLGKLSLSKGEMSLLGLRPGDIKLKRQCGAMLQLSGLPDMSTVKEHIQLFQSYYPNPMPYQKIIDTAGLNELEQQYSKNLSGGQKQRLLFALSICGDPKLLFLDEPSVGLDISSRRALWKAIRDLKANGTSIILTTHYLEEADQLSDRIIMLNKGQIIKTGSPREIKSHVKIKMVRFTSLLDKAKLMDIDSIIQFSILGENKEGCLFEIQTDDPVKTLRSIFNMNVRIDDLSVNGAGLEEAFLQLNDNSNLEKTNKINNGEAS